MEELLKLVKSFKNPLDPNEQQKLLIEYLETRDEDIRMKLLEHNLRLCSKCSIDLCKKYNIPDFAEEGFSIAYMELSNSLEKYNPYNESNCSFANYAYTNMKYVLGRSLLDKNWEQSFFTENIVTNEDGEVDDILLSIIDTSESNIPESVANQEIIIDILNFINKMSPKKKTIMKLYLGIDQPRKYTHVEIHEKLNVSRQYISYVINHCFAEIKEHLIQTHPETFTRSQNKTQSNQNQFKDKSERNDYIINCYFGLNGNESKKINEIAEDTNLTDEAIKRIIDRHKKHSQQKIQSNRLIFKRVASYNNQREEIFNAYFGLNNFKVHTSVEISNKFNLPHKSSLISTIIKYTSEKYIQDGKYTLDEIENLKLNRKNKLKEYRILEKYAPMYFSYHGLNNYEKRSIHQIAKDLKLSPSTVSFAIKEYQNYVSTFANDITEITNNEISQ